MKNQNVVIPLIILVLAPLLCLSILIGLSIKKDVRNQSNYVLSTIQSHTSTISTAPKQPVYLMVRCPKGGGDVVFNITDDIALRQVYPN